MTSTPSTGTAPQTSGTSVASRLLTATSKSSYDPLLDIDWDAPLSTDQPFMPLHRVSLYGTSLWEDLTPQQRVDLSRREMASIAATGLWFENILIQMLTRWAYHQDPREERTHYALAEIGDETRHIQMFAKALTKAAMPNYGPARWLRHTARAYKATARGLAVFVPVLVAEETLDLLQRDAMRDQNVEPLVRMVNRIHVVEEARHVRFARAETERLAAALPTLPRHAYALIAAIVSVLVVESFIDPQVYTDIGLDTRAAVRAARSSAHQRENRRWMCAHIMAFLTEQGLTDGPAGLVYRAAGLL